MNKRTLRDLGDFVAERRTQATSTFWRERRKQTAVGALDVDTSTSSELGAPAARAFDPPPPGVTPGAVLDAMGHLAAKK